jgi:hypothetical protein
MLAKTVCLLVAKNVLKEIVNRTDNPTRCWLDMLDMLDMLLDGQGIMAGGISRLAACR